VCPLLVFWVYKSVADSGDVVIQGQGFSIIDMQLYCLLILICSLFFSHESSLLFVKL